MQVKKKKIMNSDDNAVTLIDTVTSIDTVAEVLFIEKKIQGS